jgi:hypothetical protein
MATASQNSTYYPDPNMGMAMQMGSTRYTPTSAKDAMDRYFRAYWNTQSERAKDIEERQTKVKMMEGERAWNTGEREKDRAFDTSKSASDRAFRASEAEKDRTLKSQLNDQAWQDKQDAADKAGRYAWVEALTRMGGTAATYDYLYNEGKMRKSMFDTLGLSLKKQFANEKKTSDIVASYQQAIPTSSDPSLGG